MNVTKISRENISAWKYATPILQHSAALCFAIFFFHVEKQKDIEIPSYTLYKYNLELFYSWDFQFRSILIFKVPNQTIFKIAHFAIAV